MSIDYDQVKKAYPTYKDIADAFSSVKESWELAFPYVEPVAGEVPTGKLSDYVLDIASSRKLKRNMAVNFGIKFQTGPQLSSNDLFIFDGDRKHYYQMYYTHAQVLMLCMYMANTKFPGHRWIVKDCGGMWYTHLYHNSYHVLDILYPVFEDKKFWKEDNFPYRTLIPGIVDLPKLYYFLSLIKRLFPYSQLLVNRAMHNILSGFGSTVTSFVGDTPNNDHAGHIHLGLGSKINFEADVGV